MPRSSSTFWLASYPRSGNTFVRFLMKRQFGFNTPSDWEFEAPIHCSLTAGLNETKDDRPTFAKTHDLVADQTPALVLIRDGRDAVISHVHYQRAFWGWTEPFPELLERAIDPDDDFCGDWSGFYRHWLYSAKDKPVSRLRYEDLVGDPVGTLSRALEPLLGYLPESPENGDPPPFSRFHAQNPKFFRCGYSGYWRHEMPPALKEMFARHHGEMLAELGYDA